MKPKDKLDKEDKVGLVYLQPCAGVNGEPCPDIYIGETERTAAARFKEHTSTAMDALGKYKSAMLQHAHDNGHHFRLEDQTIMAYESDWVKRGIYEAAFIKTLKPSINIDPGRHQMSSHFDSILKSVITAPPPPPPHNPEIESLINTAPRRPGRPRKEPTVDLAQSQPQPHVVNRELDNERPQPQRQSQRIRDRHQRAQPSTQ